MDTKICSKCKKELPLDNFNWRDKMKGTRRSECKECFSKYMKKKYQQKKKEIQEVKSDIACAKCGEKRGYVLDFHHIDPSLKITTIARLTSNASKIEDAYEEMKKCIVLCSNCHREFHYLNNQDNSFTLIEYLKTNNAR